MNTLNKILIIIATFVAVLFAACEKEPIDIIEPIEPIEVHTVEKFENALINSAGKASAGGFTMDCITINYPFGFVSESGTTTTVSNTEEIEALLSNEDDAIIDFAYPFDVTLYKESTITTINNTAELVVAFIGCIPTEGWDSFEQKGFPAFEFEGLCKDLAFPISLQSDKNTIIKVKNEREFADALASGFLYFKFPVALVSKEGNTIAADDEKALMNALFNCDIYVDSTNSDRNISPFDFATCFDIYYPATLTDELGNTVTVNNVDELYALLFSGEVIDFVYPTTIVSEEETTIVVNNENELTELIEECFNAVEPPEPPIDSIFCFIIDYPVQMIDSTGFTVTVNNEEQHSFPNSSFDFIYPITITLEDGTITSIYNRDEIMNIWEGCEDDMPIVNPPANSDLCFTVDYPVEMVDSSGMVLIVNNDDEFIIPYGLIDYVYPLAITLEDGTFTNIDNQCELYNMLAMCDDIDDVPVVDFPINYNGCFAIGFPVQTIDAFGYTNTAYYADELNNLLLSSECVDLIYPVTIIRLDNGNTFDVDNLYHLSSIATGCTNNPPFINPLCFGFEYPIQTIDSLGFIKTYDHSNYEKLLKYLPNGETKDFIYPFNIVFPDTTLQTINIFDEFSNAVSDCP